MDAVADPPGALDPRRSLSLAALVVSNLLPVAGVLAWGWDVGSLVVLYWSENLVIGFYTTTSAASIGTRRHVR